MHRRWLARGIRTTVKGRCPACGDGPLFQGVFQLHETCAVCDVRFDRHEGNWLGPTILGYTVAAIAAMVVGVLIVRTYGFHPWLTPVLLGVAVATALLTFRPLKALWIWVLWESGFVYADGQDE